MQRQVLFFLVILIFFAGCRQPKPDKGVEVKYRIAALKGPSAIGMIGLIDSLNNVPGASVGVEIMNEPIQVRKIMLDGTADFAILPTNMAAILYNKGLDYRLLAIPVWGTLYLAGNDSTIARWEDLRNKTVYVMAKGMTPDVLFRCLLQENGLDPEKDLVLDYSFPTHLDLANAMAAGRVNLGVISEPMASLVILRKPSLRRIFDFSLEWSKKMGFAVPETAFLVKGSILKEHPDLVHQIIDAYEKSTVWVNREPAAAAALIVKYGILPDTAAAEKSISGSNLHFLRANAIRHQIDGYLKVLYDNNPEIVGGKLPDEKFVY